jgi:hypothetical protein
MFHVTKKHKKYALSFTESITESRKEEIKKPFTLFNDINKYNIALNKLYNEMNIYYEFSCEFTYNDDDIHSDKIKYDNVNRCFNIYQSCYYELSDEKYRLFNNKPQNIH